jgi:TrpR family trp operon transcriptional repressor
MKPIDRLAGSFCSVTDRATMKRFFAEIFTPAEIDDLVLRWRLMEMLEAGASQRAIAGRLGISLCKITRGSKVLRSRRSITRSLMVKQAGERKRAPAGIPPAGTTQTGASKGAGTAPFPRRSPKSPKR